jgi:hypothetical protein
LVNSLFEGHIWSITMALFQLEGSSNEESEFERVRFSENRCGYSQGYKRA